MWPKTLTCVFPYCYLSVYAKNILLRKGECHFKSEGLKNEVFNFKKYLMITKCNYASIFNMSWYHRWDSGLYHVNTYHFNKSFKKHRKLFKRNHLMHALWIFIKHIFSLKGLTHRRVWLLQELCLKKKFSILKYHGNALYTSIYWYLYKNKEIHQLIKHFLCEKIENFVK